METSTELLYRRYRVNLEFLNGVAGGTPLVAGLISQHMRLFAEGVSNPLKYAKKVEGEVTEEAMQEYLSRCSSGFPADEKGIYLRGFNLNAMLKDAAQRTKATLKTKGLGNTIRDGGLLFPDKIYLGVFPVIVERPVKPDNGPSNIKVFQVAEGVTLSIPCAVLENGDLPDILFRQLWIVAQGIGLGSNRHLGYGQFKVLSIKQEEDWDVTKLLESGADMVSPVPVEVLPTASPATPPRQKTGRR